MCFSVVVFFLRNLNAVLLFYTQISAGNIWTFVLESCYVAAAIILPGLTVRKKTVKYFQTFYLGVSYNIVQQLVWCTRLINS